MRLYWDGNFWNDQNAYRNFPDITGCKSTSAFFKCRTCLFCCPNPAKCITSIPMLCKLSLLANSSDMNDRCAPSSSKMFASAEYATDFTAATTVFNNTVNVLCWANDE